MSNNKNKQKADLIRRKIARHFSDTVINVPRGAEAAFTEAFGQGMFDNKTVVIFPYTDKSEEVLDLV